MNVSKGFDIVSSSGDSFLLMRYLKDCSCKEAIVETFDKSLPNAAEVDKKINSEFSAFVDCFENMDFSKTVLCDRCFNLGELFKALKTEPFRKASSTSVFSSRNILEPNFVSMDNKTYHIYLDEKYSSLSFKDLICNVHNESISNVFKIIGKEVLKFENFFYVELTVTNINNSKLEGLAVFDYVKASKLY